MKTKKGAYRFVIFSKNYVFKFPTLRYAFGVCKNIPKMILHGDGKFIITELSWGLKNWMRGVKENQSEYLCWRRMKSPFLAPTHTSFFGLCNVQKRIYGEMPSREYLNEIFALFPVYIQSDLAQVEAHCLEPGNFIKTPIGICLIDYDNGTSSSTQKLSFTTFLEKWNKELLPIFIPKIKK